MSAPHPSFIDLLGADAPVIDIVDVGAMDLGLPKDPSDGVYRLYRPGKFSVVGFEPVQSECDKLNAMATPGRTYLPYFIGDGSTRTFYLTAATMCSSLYEPNMDTLRHFQALPEFMQVTDQGQVQTKRLDDIPQIKNIDYIKIDVQGAELDVMRGGRRTLRGAALIETEVEFTHLYRGQPLFADVDAEMRSQGFILHTMHRPSGRCYWPFVFSGDPNANGSQALWSDAFYIPDPSKFDRLEPARLLKLAVLVHEVLTSFDLAAYALAHYDRQMNTRIWHRYMKLFMENPPQIAPMR